jgi:hypothetical protein
MNQRFRRSKTYIGVAFDPAIKQWFAYTGKSSKRILASCGTELDAAKAYNAFMTARDGFNAGFLLTRINDLESG